MGSSQAAKPSASSHECSLQQTHCTQLGSINLHNFRWQGCRHILVPAQVCNIMTWHPFCWSCISKLPPGESPGSNAHLKFTDGNLFTSHNLDYAHDDCGFRRTIFTKLMKWWMLPQMLISALLQLHNRVTSSLNQEHFANHFLSMSTSIAGSSLHVLAKLCRSNRNARSAEDLHN